MTCYLYSDFTGLNQLPFDLANNNKPPEFNDSDDLLMTEYSIDHCNLPGRKRKLNNIVTGNGKALALTNPLKIEKISSNVMAFFAKNCKINVPELVGTAFT